MLISLDAALDLGDFLLWKPIRQGDVRIGLEPLCRPSFWVHREELGLCVGVRLIV